MHIYALFLPSGLSKARAAEKAELVRQGFNWGAFLVTPLWAMWRGYWLALALWLIWTAFAALIGSFGHFDMEAALALYALGALAFGLEADRFRQAKLSQTGFLFHGLTLGESMGEAESLYFGRQSDLSRPTQPRSVNQSGGFKSNENAGWPDSNGSDLLGLFPPQETKR